jgi:hypothetical protein
MNVLVIPVWGPEIGHHGHHLVRPGRDPTHR